MRAREAGWPSKRILEAVRSRNLQMQVEEAYTPEMQATKEQAIADGTFMLAPNGRPTNLNKRQWLQTRTKNFLNWFGDWINDPSNASKIVDENGEPLVVYHNTDNNFTKFSKFRSLIGKLTGSALFGRGFYFSNYQGSSHRINMPVFLSVKNPAEEVTYVGAMCPATSRSTRTAIQ